MKTTKLRHGSHLEIHHQREEGSARKIFVGERPSKEVLQKYEILFLSMRAEQNHFC